MRWRLQFRTRRLSPFPSKVSTDSLQLGGGAYLHVKVHRNRTLHESFTLFLFASASESSLKQLFHLNKQILVRNVNVMNTDVTRLL